MVVPSEANCISAEAKAGINNSARPRSEPETDFSERKFIVSPHSCKGRCVTKVNVTA